MGSNHIKPALLCRIHVDIAVGFPKGPCRERVRTYGVHLDTAEFLEDEKKRAAQVQRELFQPPVFDWGPVSSWWFCCVCPQSHSLQSRIHRERQRWHHSCNALLKITRTKKCFELCDDNYPDLKISRCSTRQGEIRVRQELLGDTWQSSDQARSWLELPAGFPPSDHIYSGTTRTGTLDF